MKEFNLTANLWKIPYSNFSEKDRYVVTATMNGSRIGKEFTFEGYGNIVFSEDDKDTHWKPIVQFNENPDDDVKCLIYKFRDDSVYKGNYDYMIIYQSIVTDNNYGIFWYNSETGKTVHIYIIEHNIESLFSSIAYTTNFNIGHK